MEVNGEGRVARIERPEARHLPVCKGFNTVRFSENAVAEGLGNDQVYRGRIRLNTYGSRFDRLKIVITVAENGRIQREAAGQRGPVTIHFT